MTYNADAAKMTPQEGILYLGTNLQWLSNETGRRDFAQSLVSQYKKKGTLSGKQWEWVGKLVDMLKNPPAPPKPVAQIGEMAGIVALFEKVGSKLKYPAIVLQTDIGQEARISRAALGSHNPGFIYVKLDGQYLGKISPKGEVFGIDKGSVIDLLKELQADPAGVAAAHGKLTGKCCFCNTGLTDQKSLDVGYGPTCAKHYGLPWGSSGVEKIVEAEIEFCGLEEIEETVLAFEQEQMVEKSKVRGFVPVPGRACKDLLEMMK